MALGNQLLKGKTALLVKELRKRIIINQKLVLKFNFSFIKIKIKLNKTKKSPRRLNKIVIKELK